MERVEHEAPTRSPTRRRPVDNHPTARFADHGGGVASSLGNVAVGRILSGSAVQRAGTTGAQQLNESVARVIEDRRGQGSPLTGPVRDEMESSLGDDFSTVRIHTDGAAHELNAAVNARAFTTGNDVFFKQGTYDPASTAGKELLAHELTHVVQQRTGASGLGPNEVSHPSDTAEKHAAEVGRRVATRLATEPPVTAAAGLARQAGEEEDDEFQMSRAVARGEEDLEELDEEPDLAGL